jgi:hypothetical protein
MLLENPKRKTHKIHMNEGYNKDLKTCLVGTIFFQKQKIKFQMDF